jgi:hypothetical protein
MTTIHFDVMCSDDQRRYALYKGDIFIYSSVPETRELCALAQNLIDEAFYPLDARTVDQHLSREECARILANLKPRFIHHPICKELLPKIVVAVGAQLEQTYFDVPRMRTAYPTDYLTSGIAFAFHPHRDTWYSAPASQLNWWIPITDLSANNCLAFYPEYFNRRLENSSYCYNYYEWNRQNREQAALHVATDTRVQPRPEEEVVGDPLKILCPPGGVILFSGAHLHETVPNTSGVARYSIDFRTVNRSDLATRRGAPTVDVKCTGTTLRDYVSCKDLSPLPVDIIGAYDDGTEKGQTSLVYSPQDIAEKS